MNASGGGAGGGGSGGGASTTSKKDRLNKRGDEIEGMNGMGDDDADMGSGASSGKFRSNKSSQQRRKKRGGPGSAAAAAAANRRKSQQLEGPEYDEYGPSNAGSNAATRPASDDE